MKRPATRIATIPPYLFARIEEKITNAREKGVDVISLGIGDPDLPTPDYIIEAAKSQLHIGENHRYPSARGMLAYRQAVADFYQKRFGVELDPQAEVCALIGSKEGIANINYCYVDPGDYNLVPSPAYPVYDIATMLAGGQPYYLPLTPQNNFLPDLAAIPAQVLAKAKILWLNYPNNPTGAICNLAFFEEAVAFAKKHDLLICHDGAYSEMTYDGYVAPSFMQVPGAKDTAIEFSSCTKHFNMTGWRVGFAVGCPEAIATLARYKSNVDSGIFQALQYAGIAGLLDPGPAVEAMKQIYAGRRDILVDGFNAMGWQLKAPKATFYLWAPVPAGFTSASFAEFILDEAGVVITPGNGYGEEGEGFFRAALTVGESRMAEAMDRIQRVLGKVSF
ncbi:MAG: LL-diaminopimelate aminotransferase [Clostridiales bacterium]|jgi:LL-diaminopimelate aminotransferase|nr:LL-diaminopimelate aminotransferase [Clostridiales bacterium]